jgi:glycosyltransferase involved in cell wall biosynthesis
MKIVFFGNAPEKNAAIRYRVIAFAEMLRAEGHTCIVCLPSSVASRERCFENQSHARKLLYLFAVFLRRIAQLRHVIGADVVFFRGPVFDYGPPFFERIIHALNPRMVFDIDDAVWEPPAHVDSPFLRFVDLGWMRKMAGMCAHAIVGNGYLEAHVKPLLPNVTIVPTCIDMRRHALKTYRAPEGPVILGWTGLKDNLGYFDVIADALRTLAARHDIVLSIATGGEFHLDGVRVENQGWTLAREFEYLQRPDIGLMPLTDTPRARGKCAFKALQYMGVGTPCVVSPIGMNAEIIEDGVTGFLAATPGEWIEKLERLILDPDLRERMGRAARKAVQERYAHAVNYPAFKKVIESVAALRRE